MNYPWRCLCFGLSQITYTVPRRRTILHFGHIFFTDALTFISPTSATTYELSLKAPGNALSPALGLDGQVPRLGGYECFSTEPCVTDLPERHAGHLGLPCSSK